jgi:hypothetical protein
VGASPANAIRDEEGPSMIELSDDHTAVVEILMATSRRLYDALADVPGDDTNRRRVLWLEIMEVQDQVTAILTPEHERSPTRDDAARRSRQRTA